MIAACPRCSTRFRIAAERLRDEGVRLRCTQCQSVFRVYPPHNAAPRRRDDPAVDAELTPPPRPPERERIVLVADPDAERGKASAAEITRLGLHAILVHDGVEALLSLQRSLASRALVDVSMPRLSGAEFCELVKRNESLCGTHLVISGNESTLPILGALRAAGLGPDAMLEHADLPDGLIGALRLGRVPERSTTMPEGDTAIPSEPAFARPTSSDVERSPDPTPSGVEPVREDDEIARAERLARIVVSDIVLYNADRFERALREGDVLSAMAGELAEGRTLFRQRVRDEISSTRDFLAEELLRVAEARTARSA